MQRNFLYQASLVILFLILNASSYASNNVILFKIETQSSNPNHESYFDKDIGKNIYLSPPIMLSVKDIEVANIRLQESKEFPQEIRQYLEKSGVKFIDNPSVFIDLHFNKAGTEKLSEISAENIGKKLAILIDNKLVMAPVIQEKIESGTVSIAGPFTKEYAQSIVNRINEEINN
jgi:hypothetical protein